MVGRAAHAEGAPAAKPRKAPRTVYFLAGGPIGVSTAPGFTLGGEVSLACWGCIRVTDLSWLGGYADVIRDFGADSFRVTVGPELGFGPLAIDGGLAISTRQGDTELGWVARGLITFGVVAAYGRLIEVPRESTHGEFGLLLKYYWRL